jgi:zinc transporter
MHLASTTHALLWAYQLSPNGNASIIEADAIVSTLKQCESNDDYLWLHVQSDAEDAGTLLRSIGFHQTVIDSLLALETRPRSMSLNQGTLVYLRGINKNPDADPEDMVSLRTWYNDNIIISARRKDRRLASIQSLRDDITANHAPLCPSALLLTMITKVADTILDTVDEMDESLVGFETREQLRKEDRQNLSVVRRQAASIRRYLAPQRDALDALLRLPDALSHNQSFELREQTDRMSRYVEDMDLLRERAIVLQDELRNRIAEQQGVRMYVLSMVTAIFLPLSFLTGVFGMNVGGLPGTESADAFGYLMLGMGGLSVCMLVAMLWKKWL